MGRSRLLDRAKKARTLDDGDVALARIGIAMPGAQPFASAGIGNLAGTGEDWMIAVLVIAYGMMRSITRSRSRIERDMHAGDETVLAGDAVAGGDLRDFLQDLRNPRELAGHWPDPEPRAERQAERGRIDASPHSLRSCRSPPAASCAPTRSAPTCRRRARSRRRWCAHRRARMRRMRMSVASRPHLRFEGVSSRIILRSNGK